MGNRTLLKAGLIVASSLLPLLAAECSIRAYDALRGCSAHARTGWYWLYRQDPYLGFRGRPGAWVTTREETIRHNPQGFRDDRDFEEVAGRSDRLLVICVGESSTYGLSAGSNGATYPARLENALRRLSGDERWFVLNAGMPGYTSYEILQLIHLRLLRLRPDIIVSMNLRNDYEFVARSLDASEDYDFYPLRLAQLSASFPNEILMRSSLYGLIASRARALFVDDLGGRPPSASGSRPTARGLAHYADNLALTALLCERSHTALMFVDQPVDVNFKTYAGPRREGLAEMRRALHTFCRERQIPLLAAQDVLDWHGLTLDDDVHLGKLGYERLAELLAPQILATFGSRAETPPAHPPSP